MHHRYALEVFKDGQWIPVKRGLTATLAAFAAALATLDRPAELWRAVRDDGQVFLA